MKLDLHGYGDTLQTISLAPNGDLIIAGTTKTGTKTELALVRLEGQREPGNVWHNSQTPGDVNHDGHVSPVDALIVINTLNTLGPFGWPPYKNPRLSDGFLDVNNDQRVSPVDVLIVINRINAATAALGEASSIPPVLSTAAEGPTTGVSDPWPHPEAMELVFLDFSPHETGRNSAATRSPLRKADDRSTLIQDLGLWERLVDAFLQDQAAE